MSDANLKARWRAGAPLVGFFTRLKDSTAYEILAKSATDFIIPRSPNLRVMIAKDCTMNRACANGNPDRWGLDYLAQHPHMDPALMCKAA